MGMIFGKISEELPRHSVIATQATYVIRRYEPSIAAVCDYTNGWGSTSSDSAPFGSLARYIGVFGAAENVQSRSAASEKIAMTAPVVIDLAQPTHAMKFLLPRTQYASLEGAPKPTNPRVRLEELPERVVAVRTFTGNLRAERARENLDQLLKDLAHDGLWHAVKAGDGNISWQAAGYNAPFVLPWFKTNEIHVAVKEHKGTAE